MLSKNNNKHSIHSTDFEITLKINEMNKYGFFLNDILQMSKVSKFSGNNYYLISRCGKEEFCKIMMSQNSLYILTDKIKKAYSISLMHKIQFKGILVSMIRMNQIN